MATLHYDICGVQTNHGRLTVAAAIKYGLEAYFNFKGKKPDYYLEILYLID